MFKRLIVFVLVVLFSSTYLYADYKKIKVTGRVVTSNKKPSETIKREALNDARKQALEKYISNLDSSKVRLINKIRESKNLKELEDDVRLLDNGILLNEWENAVVTGKKEDAENYLDVIIDALVFFSK